MLFGFIAALVPASFASAQSQSSANFKNLDSSFVPVTMTAQSPHYALDGSLEPIVGLAQSGSFKVESGSQGEPGTTPTPTPPGGGTGGGNLGSSGEIPPTLGGSTSTCQSYSYVWVYRSTWNGAPLHLGDNTVGCTVVHRRLIGDVNDNRVVDDVDLSLFTRYWKVYDRQGDFNEDGLIDDVDLSLFASHWGQSY
jgi:hypothetical protein